MSQAIYNEIEPFAAQWMRNLIAAGHIAPGVVDERSISDLTAADVAGPGQRHFFAGIGGWSLALRLAGVDDEASIWTGSCPCQPFSVAGDGGGIDDARHLWPAWFALIAECRPSVIFGEQVASAAGLGWLDLVCADLEGSGYSVGAADLCAASVGASHIRQRLWWVAYAAGVNGKTHGRVGTSRARRASLAAGGLPRLSVAGRWWSATTQRERLPVLVPNYHGLSSTLAGFGNAIVPQVAATFIRAALEAA